MDRPLNLLVQRIPSGLQSILGLLGTGDTPHFLGQELRSVLETTDLYLSDRIRMASAATTVNIASTGAFLFGSSTGVMACPSGEIRFVYGLSVTSAAMTAGATIRGMLGFQRTFATPSQTQLLGPPVTVAPAEIVATGVWWERPLIMRPGDQPLWYNQSVAGAPAIPATGWLWYVPIPV